MKADNNEAKIYCIYHRNCLDGFTAAWTVWRNHRNATFIDADYGEPLPQVDKDSIVVIVDFSYPPEDLIKLASICHTVMVFDHHDTAIKKIEDYREANSTKDKKYNFPSNLILSLNNKKSGARLTWEWFCGRTSIPDIVLYVEDRDLWKFKYKPTKEYTRALSSLPFVFEEYDAFSMSELRSIMSLGKALLKDDDLKIKWHLDNATRRVKIDGVEVPLVNVPKYLVSETLNRIVAYYPFVAGYHDTETQRIIRLNSAKGGVEVNKIAEKYGGGGHPNSASFKLPRDHELAKV